MSTGPDPLELTRALIRCPSVTPVDAGALDVLQGAAEAVGFHCHRLTFADPGSDPVDNLYARIGQGAPNFCFAGHTDVVSVGDEDAWTVDPFAAEIRDGRLYGRGASDMKAALACFVAAAARYLDEAEEAFDGSISLLLTGDEEGPAVNGTVKVLRWLQERGEGLDACLVGEPTNPGRLGETVKIGRRGSLNGVLTVTGAQGHVAYPHLADNPVPRLLDMLRVIADQPLDAGTEHFQPSQLTVTSVDVGNRAANVIPAEASARFNIRFNDRHTSASLQALLDARCAEIGGRYSLAWRCSGEAFLSPPGRLSAVVAKAVQKITGRMPELSTSGGTSDARFIKDACPVVEFGMCGETAHKVDENIPVADVAVLADVYRAILAGYFADAA